MRKKTTGLTPSLMVPRRAPGTRGRHPQNFPNLNYQSLGQSLGICPTYVGRILNGICRPSMKIAERLGSLMGWTIDEVNSIYAKRHFGNNEESSKGHVNRHAKSRNSRTTARSNPSAGDRVVASRSNRDGKRNRKG